MTAAEELRLWLARLRARLALGAILRGCAILAGAALGVTLVVVVIANRYAFSARSVQGGRLALGLALALCAALGLGVPLWRLTRAYVVGRAERQMPQFEARLRTFTERGHEPGPFAQLLAADTLRVARDAPPAALVPATLLAVLAGIGLACIGTLAWLVRSGPGYMGYGAALVWAAPRGGALYDLKVKPGDAGIRRHADFLVSAQTVGLATRDVRLHVRIGHGGWQSLSMQPRPLSPEFRYLLAALPDDTEYWVEAGPLSSGHYHVHVSDVPQVRQVRVTYHYPAWTGLPDRTEEHGGDLQAVQGTQALLTIITDQPLASGALVLDDGRELALKGSGTSWNVQLPLAKDGTWHITTVENRHPARISPEWSIEATPPTAPQVAIVRPVNEYHASPIEEVTIAAQAAADFGLNRFELHWSVNGGPERTKNLLPHAGAKQARGIATLSLEDMKLAPGDVVSVYAQARDARAESRSAILFVQADPFEREYSQSQAGGGGGGGGLGNDQAEISRREKEIITATWAQLAGGGAPPPAAAIPGVVPGDRPSAAASPAVQAVFLSGVQDTLHGQALSLAGRLQMRDLTQANEQFGSFEQEMSAAAQAMMPAAQNLKSQHWREALPDEQKALQHLLRAEATFRQIQVAFGSRGAGSGGSMGRDLASLSDLELDTQKNQYETAQQVSPQEQSAARIDEALRKLDELARQQEQLAGQPGNASSAAEQRWNQEMLRRNAEELQRQLQQLMVQQGEQGGQQSGQSGQGQQANGQQSGQQGQPGQSGSGGGGRAARNGAQGGTSAAGNEQVAEALRQLQAAQEAMRRAAGADDAAGARRAAADLRAARDALGGMQQQHSLARLDDLAAQAGKLAARAREQQERLRGLTTRPNSFGRGGQPLASADSMVDDRQQLADQVARLRQELRDAQAEVLKNSREAGRRLRDALAQLDDANVETRLQRSADMLRQGYNTGADPDDDSIANDLAQLGEQIRQARVDAASGKPGSDAALEGLQSFSARLARLDPRSGQSGNDSSGSNQPGSNGGQRGSGQAGTGGPTAGRVTGGGGGADGYVNGGWNTGNNQYGLGVRAGPGIENRGGADRQREFDQGLADLTAVRRAVADDPETRRQVDELIQAMQKLDPRRFPGNPQLVDALFAEVRSGADRLELQLGHDPGADHGAVRSGAPPVIPEGYQSAVADYYKRLSRGQ